MARMVGENGRVVGIDVVPQLVEESIKNMNKDDPALLQSGRVTLEGTCVKKTEREREARRSVNRVEGAEERRVTPTKQKKRIAITTEKCTYSFLLAFSYFFLCCFFFFFSHFFPLPFFSW